MTEGNEKRSEVQESDVLRELREGNMEVDVLSQPLDGNRIPLGQWIIMYCKRNLLSVLSLELAQRAVGRG